MTPLRAIRRAGTEAFGIVPLSPPFEKVTTHRPDEDRPHKAISRVSHPTSVIAVMNMHAEMKPLEE